MSRSNGVTAGPATNLLDLAIEEKSTGEGHGGEELTLGNASPRAWLALAGAAASAGRPARGAAVPAQPPDTWPSGLLFDTVLEDGFVSCALGELVSYGFAPTLTGGGRVVRRFRCARPCTDNLYLACGDNLLYASNKYVS